MVIAADMLLYLCAALLRSKDSFINMAAGANDEVQNFTLSLQFVYAFSFASSINLSPDFLYSAFSLLVIRQVIA